MKMTGSIKKKGAAALAFVLVLSAGLSSVYGAPGIETGRSCSLSFELDGQYEELNQTPVPVHLYRVAEVEETGEYAPLAGYESLELGTVSDSTTAEQWEALAQEAVSLTDTLGAEPEASLTIRPDTEGTPSGLAEDLPTGMYLIEAETVRTAEYSYEFAPYLVSLPNNYYYTTGDDAWVYDVTTGLKPEQTPRYGSLVIEKTLTSYNATLGDAVFVFQVEGTRDHTQVISDVVSLNFDGTGTKRVEIAGIPAGTAVTVTEIYGGSNYDVTSSGTQTAVIVADGEEGAPATVSFTNEYNGGRNPGSGIVNHFAYTDGVWDWEQQTDSSQGLNLQPQTDDASGEQEAAEPDGQEAQQ